MKQIKVLHVLNGLQSGGAETFIMNILRTIDRNRIKFDFLIRSNVNNVYYEEIQSLGGEIHILPEFPRKFFRNLFELNKFLKNEKYDVIHVHANSMVYIFPLLYAKKYNIRSRIIHSHNTQAYNKIAEITHLLLKDYVNNLTTHKIACSEEAGRWMFGNSKFIVLNNAIDFEKYRLNKKLRIKVRERLGLENKFVVGHIGRFVEQKNHAFLLEIFIGILDKNRNSVMVLLGEGPTMHQMKKLVESLNLMNHVLFLGVCSNVSEIIQSFDVFLFPSLFEGLPFTLLEVQASGTPCIASNQVDCDVKICDGIKFLDLNDSKEDWVNQALTYCEEEKSDVYNEVKKSKYDIYSNVTNLQNIYLEENLLLKE